MTPGNPQVPRGCTALISIPPPPPRPSRSDEAAKHNGRESHSTDLCPSFCSFTIRHLISAHGVIQKRHSLWMNQNTVQSCYPSKVGFSQGSWGSGSFKEGSCPTYLPPPWDPAVKGWEGADEEDVLTGVPAYAPWSRLRHYRCVGPAIHQPRASLELPGREPPVGRGRPVGEHHVRSHGGHVGDLK